MSSTGLLPGIESGLGWVGNKLGDAGNWLSQNGLGGATQSDKDKMAALNGVGQQSLNFAGQAQSGFNQLGAQGQRSLNALNDIASGKNSVSAEQLRQGLQQNLAAQQSMAAGAAPNNAAMAARNAAQNMGRLGYGLAGQQAVAGLAERNQAQGQYAGLLGTLRGQDLQGTLGGYQNATNAYSSGLNNTRDPTALSQIAPAISAGAYAFSDKRLKTNVREIDDRKARGMLNTLSGYEYDYKDERNGKGRQVGVMAQDLERAGLGHAVTDTPGGKAVNGAKLALGLTGLLANVNERLNELEGRSADKAPGSYGAMSKAYAGGLNGGR